MEKREIDRIVWIDVMKGILIILMVLGHTYVEYKDFIYLFHMAVFFMISGYCWNDKYSENIYTAKSFIIKKIIRLYIPFVVINVSYILLTNLFIDVGIYTNSPDFLNYVGSTPVEQQITNYMSIASMGMAILRAICFAGGAAQLAGATWFLTELFLVSVFHCILILILKRIKLDTRIKIVIVFIISLTLASIANYTTLSSIGALNRLPSAYTAYLVGVLIKKYEKKSLIGQTNSSILINSIAIFVSFLGLTAFYLNGVNIELAYSKISNPLTYIICSLLGWVLIRSISILISRNIYVTNSIQYLGKNTIPILLFHTISFKVVSYLYIIISNVSILLLASYPVIFSTPEWMRYIYLCVGILIPIVIYNIYLYIKCCRNKLNKKLEKACE